MLQQNEISENVCMLTYLMGLSDETKFLYADKLHYGERKKGSMLLFPEQYSTQLFFITSGSCRIFFENGGKEITSHLAFETDIAVSYQSFISGRRSKEAIQALEDVQYYYITKEDLYDLYNKSDEINTLGRKLNEYYLLKLQNRIELLQLLSARERYLYVLEKTPNIVNRVPSIYLASYLGITAETLSRVRASL